MGTIEEKLKEYGGQVNRALDGFLPQPGGLENSVAEAMRYSALAGGKRIRPVLTLEFCRVCGGDPAPAMPCACALEMVHTYSLIHDDLPCMDNDDMRRGKPSCHVKFGEATAMLAGDALLSLAFETALCDNYIRSGRVKAENVLRAARELATASGVFGMVGGQIIDLESEDRRISLDTLEFMHNRKTGAMIRAAARMGCILADAPEEKIAAADAFAKRIGLAFQIVDDILDMTGDAGKLGKPVGSDQENDKTTYITHLGLEKSRRLARRLTDEAIQQLGIFGRQDFLTGLAEYLAARDR